MKLIQSCPCGADIRVESEPGHSAERTDAQEYLGEWRTAHEPCLERLGTSSPPAGAPDFDIDEHDDLTEDKLLERLERHGLLRKGDTALSVRAALDA